MKISSILICFFVVVPLAFGDLQFGFYSSTCPQAESIVQQVVQKRFGSNESITAALLRMHFHDCFVRGSDASILIDSTWKNKAEKEAPENKHIRGFDLIDEVKESLEAACPSTVSCADIIALASRDAVALSGGPKYDVPTGRRDGFVSVADEVDLPLADMSVSEVSQRFAAKGFTKQEMVTLLGAHTVGVAHFVSFKSRLSSCGGEPDPTMDPALDAELVGLCNCTPGKEEPAAVLDHNTPVFFYNEYFKQILVKSGVLQIDQQIALDPSTIDSVNDLASNGDEFNESFADAIIKMGRVEVLVGSAGEVRKNCRALNPRS